jgi:cytochrome c oxidase assembly protein subunit 15
LSAKGPILHSLVWLLAVATFLLVIAGGQVTSTDSGDAVPTWPLPLMLPMEGGVFYELGHRQIAVFVGVLTLILLAVAIGSRKTLSVGVLRWTALAAALVVAQALLGAGRVWLGARLETAESLYVTAFGVAHALLGQLFFCVSAAIVYLVWRRPEARRRASGTEPDRRLQASVRLAVLVLILQFFLGALLRLTRPGPVPLLVLLHMLGAVLVSYSVAEIALRVARQKLTSLRLGAKLAVTLLAVQIGLGFFAFFAVQGRSPAVAEVTWATVVPTVHVAVGALLLMVVFLMALSFRYQSRGHRFEPQVPTLAPQQGESLL